MNTIPELFTLQKLRRLVGIVAIFCIALTAGCLDPYMPPEVESVAEFLVIDAMLNTSEGLCEVTLKRTIPLDSKDTLVVERFAIIQLYSDDGSFHSLTETEPGKYIASGLMVDVSKKYRVQIQTFNGKQYTSEEVIAKTTPAIDSVTWKPDAKETLNVFVHTHDETSNPGYYLWRFEETWTYHSAFQSIVKFENGEVIYRNSSTENIYNCWGSDRSTDILVASTSKLERNIISDFRVVSRPLAVEKLHSRYSILVKQYSITRQAFEYWELLKKNTENLGTLFDPLPSQVFGNFTCTTHPDEPVLGFFSATSVTTKRIFVNHRDLPKVKLYTQYDDCTKDFIYLVQLPNFSGLLIAPVVTPSGVLIGYERGSTFCVDCRVSGGTNIKPDFWE